MKIYKKVRRQIEVVDKCVCDRCRRQFKWGKQGKRFCGSVVAEMDFRTDYLETKMIWQTQQEMHLCYGCLIEFFKWLRIK